MKSTKKDMSKKISLVLALLFAAAGLLSLALLFPQIRELIIAYGEKKVGRTLNHQIWHQRILTYEVETFFCFAAITSFFAYFAANPLPTFLQSRDGIFGFRKTVSSIFKSNTRGAELLAVLAVLTSVRCFYISQKKSYHVDEPMSIAICNRNEYGIWGKDYKTGIEYTGKEVKEMSLWDNPSPLDALSDVFHMHQNTTDSPHTNFYYTFLRLWFTGVKTADTSYIFWRGCALNLVFFLFSFFFMTLLLRRFTDDKLAVCLCLLAAFVNPAALSITVFLRPYELQQVFVIILTYYVVCCLQAIKQGLLVDTKKNFIIGVFVLALTMLSAYFNLIILGLYGIVLIFICARKKNANLLSFFIIMFAAALVVAKLLYFKYGAMGDIGQDAAQNLSPAGILVNLKAERDAIVMIFSNNKFWRLYSLVVLAMAAAAIVLGALSRIEKDLAIVLGVNLASSLLILYFVPIFLKSLRYIAPLFSIAALCFAVLCKRRKLNNIVAAAGVLILACALATAKQGGRVDHLDDSLLSNYKELQEAECMVFIRGKGRWRYSCLIPYLSDNSKVVFVSDFSEIKILYPDLEGFIFVNQLDERPEADLDYESFGLKRVSRALWHDIYRLSL